MYFELTNRPPSASLYRNVNSSNSNSSNDRNAAYSDEVSKQINKIIKDPLSRRLMSLITPITTVRLPMPAVQPPSSNNESNHTSIQPSSSLSFENPIDTPATANAAASSSSSNDSISNNWKHTSNIANLLLSPYPHPSYPHREETIEESILQRRRRNNNTSTSASGSISRQKYGLEDDVENSSGINDNDNYMNNNDPIMIQNDYQYFFYPRKIKSDIVHGSNVDINTTTMDDNSRFQFHSTMRSNNSSIGNDHNHRDNRNKINSRRLERQSSASYYDHNNNHHQHQQHQQQPYHDYYQNQYEYNNNTNSATNSCRYTQSRFVRNQDNTSSIQTTNYSSTASNDNNRTLTTTTATVQQNWDQVGQIGNYRQGLQYDDCMNSNNNKNNTTCRKKKKKRQKKQGLNGNEDNDYDEYYHNEHEKQRKKRKQKSKNKNQLPDVRDFMISSPIGNGPGDVDVNTNNNTGHEKDDIYQNDDDELFHEQPRQKQRSKKHSKQTTIDRSQTSTTNDVHNITKTKEQSSSQFITSLPYETLRDFVETYQIKNAGASNEALCEFKRLIQSKTHVSWTMIYQDYLCSNTCFPSSKRYCTDKGPKCAMWNCTCDNQIRAVQASKPLLGAMFVFPCFKDAKGSEGCLDGGENCNSGASSMDTFILPLAPTCDPDDGTMKDIDAGYERMALWPFLPMACDTTVKQRWDTLRCILTNKHLTCVTFNSQVTLMPYHYHCAMDIEPSSNDSFDNEGIGYMDLVLPNIWDLRLASWMLSPHSTEEELELEKKMEGFSHLLPKDSMNLFSENKSQQFVGLVNAKKYLEFLYIIYPIINNLLDDNGLKHAFDDIESPIQSVLSAMELQGIGFKASRLQHIQSNTEEKIQSLIDEAKMITKDSTFSLSSPQQVASLLYDKMGISMPQQGGTSRNNTQQRSTSEEVLKQIQKEFKARNNQSIRMIEIILEFRGLSKMLNTYIKPYPKLARENHCRANYSTGGSRKKRSKKSKGPDIKIYPMWMQTTVRTGRLSCRKPNIQQLPSSSDYLEICPRSAFIASSKQHCLFACDYSQNEVRILAHISGDEALIALFKQPGSIDIYKQMSSIITGKNVQSITSKERSIAKQVTLAIIYGMGINNVAKKLSITKVTAQNFFKAFYGRFKGVKAWMGSIKEFARKNKYVTTITGRRRYLDNIDSEDTKLRAQAERQAVNSVIQGSAADLIKIAMLKMASRITDWRKEGNSFTSIPPKMLLQIHDELVFELKANKEDVENLKAIVIRCCTEECVEELQLKVPLTLSCSVGASWGNMNDLK